ncbi:MAG: alpha/beta fold hydrolase [Aeromicrobium erythreum]
MDDAPTSAPAIEGFDYRHVEVNGLRLHYVEAGREHGGPPLLLVHGWPQHFWIWRHVARDLAQDHHVVAVDLRGHGWSEVAPPGGDAYDKRTLASDLEELVRALDLDRPVLVGHDWGSLVSLVVASRSPELVRGVVAVAMVAPWARLPLGALPKFFYQVVAAGPWGRLAHQGLDQRFLRTVYTLGAGRGPRLDDTEVYLERYRDRGRAEAGVAMYRRFLLREAPAIMRGQYLDAPREVPVLFVPGESDDLLNPRLVAGGATRPNTAMEAVASAGHWVPEQQPAVLVEKVRRFAAAHA